LHPAWPFGNLREVYDCTKEIPQGLNSANADRNGHCVWWVHVVKQGWPFSEGLKHTYDAEYERVLRQAVFNVIWSYPRQAFELYFYYKPLTLARTLVSGLKFDFKASTPAVVVMLLGQAALLAAFVICAARSGRRAVSARSAIFVLLFVFSLAPQLVGWSSL